MHTLKDGNLERTAPLGMSRSGSGAPALDTPARPGRELVDERLLEEIALLADVIAALSGVGSHLSLEQVDAVLGLPRDKA